LYENKGSWLGEMRNEATDLYENKGSWLGEMRNEATVEGSRQRPGGESCSSQ